MEMIDHPRLAEAPTEFRVHCARLVLVWFWMSWAADQGAEKGRENAIEGEPADKDPARGVHAATSTAGAGDLRGAGGGKSARVSGVPDFFASVTSAGIRQAGTTPERFQP